MPKIHKLFEIIKEQKSAQEEPEEENKLTSYVGLISGTAEWMEFWKQNPEKQKEMLEYTKNKGEE